MPLFLSRKEGERFAIFDSDAVDAKPLVQVLVAEIGREVLLAIEAPQRLRVRRIERSNARQFGGDPVADPVEGHGSPFF